MRILLSLFVIALTTTTAISQEYLQMIESENYTVQEIIDSAENYFSNKEKGKGSGYKQFKRWEYNALRLVKDDGYLRTIDETQAEFERQEAYLNETASNRAVLNDNWQELGPTSINPHTSWSPGLGRITAISIDESDSNHIIVGAETGGVWKTIDGGQNWAPLSDYFNNLYVYSVAIDPLNADVYYFGSTGGRLYKSEDAGATWQLHATIDNSTINKILIHPTDTSIMYASLSSRGVYKSSNTGVDWAEVGSNITAHDVEFKAGDPSVVYISGEKVAVSTDNGVTFNDVAGFSNGPKMIAVTLDNPDVVYVAEAASGRFGALYKSIDAGVTFTVVADNSINYFGLNLDGLDNFGQAPRDMDIAVSPVDENEVHLAGINTWMSLDGGQTFNTTANWLIDNSASENIGYCHADIDILLFKDTTLYVGSDGGFFKAEDTQNITSSYYTDLSTGIGVKQFYKIGVAQGEEVKISGGAQDNGTSVYREDTEWRNWLGADGMETFFRAGNSNHVFGTTQNGGLFRSLSGGDSVTGLQGPGPGQGNWVTPFETDSNGVIYVGYNQVFKSTNFGNIWQPVSQAFGFNLDNLKIAPSNPNVMYASRANALYRTTDGGATNWTIVPAAGGSITSIAIHPADHNKIAVTRSSTNNVYVSLDGGDTWENYKKNLPSFSALCIIWDHNGRDGLYLGMDYGVYYIDNDLEDWVPYSTNLPNVIVNELDINNANRMLYAGTYGRGLWFSPLFDSTLNTTAFTSETLQLYPNPATNEVTLKLPLAANVDIRIFNVQGSLLSFDKNVQIDGSHTLDISNLNTGVYFMRIASDAGTITKKFIKE